MVKTMKDGWHKISGFDVYVEDGKIIRGTKEDSNGSIIPAYPYRACKEGGWDLEQYMTVNAFRAGVYRGTVTLL